MADPVAGAGVHQQHHGAADLQPQVRQSEVQLAAMTEIADAAAGLHLARPGSRRRRIADDGGVGGGRRRERDRPLRDRTENVAAERLLQPPAESSTGHRRLGFGGIGGRRRGRGVVHSRREGGHRLDSLGSERVWVGCRGLQLGSVVGIARRRGLGRLLRNGFGRWFRLRLRSFLRGRRFGARHRFRLVARIGHGRQGHPAQDQPSHHQGRPRPDLPRAHAVPSLPSSRANIMLGDPFGMT